MVDYLEDIKQLIAKQFGLETESIEEDAYLEADLNITDLDMEDLLAQIEDKYQIKIPQDTVSRFKQITDIVNYLYENVEGT